MAEIEEFILTDGYILANTGNSNKNTTVMKQEQYRQIVSFSHWGLFMDQFLQNTITIATNSGIRTGNKEQLLLLSPLKYEEIHYA